MYTRDKEKVRTTMYASTSESKKYKHTGHYRNSPDIRDTRKIVIVMVMMLVVVVILMMITLIKLMMLR